MHSLVLALSRLTTQMLCRVVNPFDQNRSSLFAPAQTLLCAGLAFSLLLVTGSANAQSKYLDNSGDVRRLADFYVIDAEADPSVCRPILLSLNKEYRISDDKLDENPRVSMSSILFLDPICRFPGCENLCNNQMPIPTKPRASTLLK